MTNKEKEIKETVKQKYSLIALQDKDNTCCSGSCCSTAEVYNIMNDDYSQLQGYNADADLGLGCGLPTQFAGIKKGDTVIDLGSGAGNDCFIARAETGETGKIIGIDFSETMLEKARKNTEKRGYQNITFRQGDIEDIPLDDNIADVVISNCVLNLLPSKDKIFHEIFRTLKAGGHFCISDVVLNHQIPSKLQEAVEMYVGCVAGAIPKTDYLQKINNAGFTAVTIHKEKNITIPDEILTKYLNQKELETFKAIPDSIISITITGVKPATVCTCGCC
ncbi:MAG: arsenite methyltransferase [Bacteroidales bacterium]|nr:arsenite methyltransferase [Bacteroidales bacterium]MDD3913248.1 arsenite methyltransferase [Bacteroidales bacterium]MDD4633279.1 arsenite methyltransferase [Bacteroidales bacterium]